MPQSNFDRVVELVRSLNSAEQWRLRDLLESWLEPPGPALTEEEFERGLASQGVLSAPPPVADLTPYQHRQLATAEGKPVSETIIEERR